MIALALTLWQITKTVQIDSIFPSSVLGWMGFAAAGIALADTINNRIKKPGEAAAKHVEETLTAKLAEMATAFAVHARQELERFETLRAEVRREAMTCAETTVKLRAEIEDQDVRLRSLSELMVQSREDRRHISQNVDELRQTIGRWREEDRAGDDRMLEAMVKLRGGKNE